MKPSIPRGTRDFSPEEVRKRNYIFDTVREVFVRYGYQPIETPTMEKLSTLTGKYGEEGDKLLFKVLNNGDFLSGADEEALRARDSFALAPSISKRGLRYDLTVPLARYVVMHQHEITLPFKRYQIQPVWRADRPQRGRYREFYQCDVDVVGSDALVCEAELAQIYDEAFARLGLDVVIRINNRKVLAGIAETAGVKDKFAAMTVAIDKLDKIGMEGVRKELAGRGIPGDAVAAIEAFLQIDDLDRLYDRFAASDAGRRGVDELRTFYRYFDTYEPNNKVQFDITLARGLDYYTGCIFEVEIDRASHPKLKMGSIGGGGRYDDLTGVFGMKGVSGVGISFGAERIYDVMEELKLFPEADPTRLQAVFVCFDDESHLYAFRCLNELRAAGINAEIYPEPVKIGKQMKYVDARNALYAIIVGSEEMKSGKPALKNMKTGEQVKMEVKEIIRHIKVH
jgi:histidyl-tRNA synthetase